MAKVRLVAYRPATSSSTSDTTYDFDLQEHPTISLNFQFSDVKNPETRKANYSQTFKLPFTQKNNVFFQNWFNVNLTELEFSTRKKFNAVLYVGSVPQFEGIIQLKSVYQKAEYYEVVLLSNTADLFTVIGSQKLKDVFKLVDETGEDIGYSDELNHTYSHFNMKASWAGTTDTFYNLQDPAVSLRDSTSNVQKVMYPLSVTRPKFYFDEGVSAYLNMDQDGVDAIEENGAASYIVPITQFRPAIQIKTLFKLILAKAGFSYTSDFIDGDYFGNIFMTTCGHINTPTPATKITSGASNGSMIVGNSEPMHEYTTPAGAIVYGNSGTVNNAAGQSLFNCNEWHRVVADTTTPSAGYTVPNDPEDLWEPSGDYFHKVDDNISYVRLQYYAHGQNVKWFWQLPYTTTGHITFESQLTYYNPTSSPINTPLGEVLAFGESDGFGYEAEDIIVGSTLCDSDSVFVDRQFNLSSVPPGSYLRIYIRAVNWEKCDNAIMSSLKLGGIQLSAWGNTYSQLTTMWDGYATEASGYNIYNQEVDIPSCIDPSIKQKDFLKDIIERFNLIVLSDPENPDNIIIEPYNDYLADSELKNWTDKLDLEKEIIIKDTTSMQKDLITLSDKEDKDLMNKSIKEELPEHNVYGKIEVAETNNDFAKGEMKNTPIFAPYINQKVFVNSNDQLPTGLPNVAVQYEYTYKKTEEGIENILEATQSKLFYYNGTAGAILNNAGKIYMHVTDLGDLSIEAKEFTTYPLCSPFSLKPSSGTSTLASTTKSLYWNQNPPICGDLSVFNYNSESIMSLNSLYKSYWEQYLNSIYNIDARIMECYVNLNEVDIFTFKFNDEIFIKDNYWRILNISNYQVGGQASTKVTLLKVGNTYDSTCQDCDYVIGTTAQGQNMVGQFWIWCASTDADCEPDLSLPNQIGLYTTPDCCECNGGDPYWNETSQAANNLFKCKANTGSLAIQMKNIYSVRSVFSGSGIKSVVAGKNSGLDRPLFAGNDRNKFSQAILPYFGDDIIIKYNNSVRAVPRIEGESHRIVLSGYTEGTTRGYAYPRGDSNAARMIIPKDTNIILRVKGTATIVGGTSTTYPLGTIEGFAYYTAFKWGISDTSLTQLGTAGGTSEFSLKEGVFISTCSLYITTSNGELQFGLDDSQTDTKRIWALTADIDINRVRNMSWEYGADWALYQNSDYIQLENGDYLIWN
jgi:hypothetical protein